MTKAEQIAPLLREAAQARIRSLDLMVKVEEILAGPSRPEKERIAVERVLEDWLDERGSGQSADGELREATA